MVLIKREWMNSVQWSMMKKKRVLLAWKEKKLSRDMADYRELKEVYLL